MAGFYLPLLIGLIEHIFKFHDKISELLKIRYKYDTHIVIDTMAKKCEICLNVNNINKANCKKIMGKIFYKYASSTKPEIDEHNILLALNEWCWFWIILDTTVLFLITSIWFLIVNYSCCNLLAVICILFILILSLWAIKKQSEIYTKAEIKEILSDPTRQEEVKEELSKCITQ